MLYGQHPYYYQLTTEDGLPTNEVYDLLEDSKGYIWVGTDNGLVRYDGKSFTNIPTSVNVNQSFTHLLETSEGQIWCFGFPANIMYVENDTLHRLINFSSKTRAYPVVAIDSNDILSITGQSVTFHYDTRTKTWADSTILPHHFVNNYYLYNNKSLANPLIPDEYYAHLDSIKYLSPPFDLLTIKRNGLFRKFNNKLLYLFNHPYSPSSFFELRNDSLISIPQINDWLGTRRIISIFTYQDSILLLGTVNGIKAIHKNYHSAFDISIMPTSSISAVFTDSENNLWTSTTEQGICIFPSINTTLYHPKNSNLWNKNVTELTSDHQHLYIGLQDGTIQRLNKKNELETIFESTGDNIFLRVLECNPFTKDILFLSGRAYTFNPKTNINSIFEREIFLSSNHVTFLSPEKLLVSGARRATVITNHPLSDFTNKWADQRPSTLFKGLPNKPDYTVTLIKNKHSICNTYNPITDVYWIGYNQGLYHYKNYKEEPFIVDNKNVYAFDLAITADGNTWIASASGLYQIDSLGNRNQITIADGLYKNTVKRIIPVDSILYLIFRDGFQAYNYRSGKFKTFDKTDGLPSSEINDIQIFNNLLYVATAKGLVSFPLDYNPFNASPPKLYVTDLFINDKKQELKTNYSLVHTDNNLHITFDIIAHRSLGSYKLKYRLKGNNDEWVINDRPSDNLRFNNLQPGDYSLELIALNEDNTPSPMQTIQFKILPPFYKTWWFLILIGLIILFLAYLFYRARIQAIQRSAAIQQRLIGSEMKAIKSQMNPHFIFNALNSIQDLILKKDTRASNKYLVKFSLLIRKVLELSSKEAISVEEELELLTFYIELEQLRFGKELSFSINYEIEEYDEDELFIPPLIIQPYVENCFKHGLLHKTGEKKLDILFKIKNQKLICTIEDNGIGREKSKEINSRRRNKNHQSFATEANQKRIDLINATQEQNINLKIIDLPNNTGTKVEVSFPILLE